MLKFKVQHDFTKSQPVWRGDYVRRYGESNEGFEVEAEDEDALWERLKSLEFNLNPFYLKVTRV